MSRITILIVVILATSLLTNAQTGPEINPDGIIFPYRTISELPVVATPGTVIWNSDNYRLELFSHNFIWEGLYGNRLIDADMDSKIELMEGLTQGSSDFIDFKTDNTLRLRLSSYSARFETDVDVFGKVETEDASIFMRNLGNTDTDQGIKWGEGNDEAIFGLVYDGEGNGANSELHLREYNFTDTDVITFKANGNVKVHNLAGSTPTPVFADAEGNLTRSGMSYVTIPAIDYEETHLLPGVADKGVKTAHGYKIFATQPVPWQSLVQVTGLHAAVSLPHGSTLKEITINYLDPPGVNYIGNIVFKLQKVAITNSSSFEIIKEFESFTDSSTVQTRTFSVNESIDNQNFYYLLYFNYLSVTPIPTETSEIYSTTLGYEYD